MQIDKEIRNTYQSEIEEKTGKKVRNVFFLAFGVNGKDIFIFMGNNNKLLGVCEIADLGTEFESHRWVATI